MRRFELIAPCHFGLEAVLKREIVDLGYDVAKVEDVLALGDKVKVQVLEVDPKTGKISLDRLDKPDAPAGAAGNSNGGGRREHGDRPRPGQGSRTPRRSHKPNND